jgi:hypothetical protein
VAIVSNVTSDAHATRPRPSFAIRDSVRPGYSSSSSNASASAR